MILHDSSFFIHCDAKREQSKRKASLFLSFLRKLSHHVLTLHKRVAH